MGTLMEIKHEALSQNPFKLIGSDWMLITAEKDGKVNTMTASWGGFGVMWGKNVAFIALRPQRYTKQFVDGSDTFSLTFFDTPYKSTLEYLGKVSGRDEDKISKSGLTVEHAGRTPYFAEANLVILCKKLYTHDINPANLLDNEIADTAYPNKDYHTLYIAEIEKVLARE